MGGVVKTTKKAFNNTVGQAKTLFTNPKKLNIGQMLNLGVAGGLDPLQQGYKSMQKGQTPTAPTDPFVLNQDQMEGDLRAINELGEKQYLETMNQIPTEIANAMNKSLPGIAEDYNAGHLLNSSGYGNEVARQHSQLAKDMVGQAIIGRQGYQTGALQRGLSLEDFVNQSNVARTLGAQMAPQVGNGKGTAVAGLGAGASAGSAFGPWGAAIGAGLGYLGGGGAQKKSGGGK